MGAAGGQARAAVLSQTTPGLEGMARPSRGRLGRLPALCAPSDSDAITRVRRTGRRLEARDWASLDTCSRRRRRRSRCPPPSRPWRDSARRRRAAIGHGWSRRHRDRHHKSRNQRPRQLRGLTRRVLGAVGFSPVLAMQQFLFDGSFASAFCHFRHHSPGRADR